MSYKAIIFDKGDGVARITLNRPHVLNAINEQLFLELKAVLSEIAGDDTVGVVVLTGAGRAFSAGVDIKTTAGGAEGSSVGPTRELALEVIEAIESLDKPVIAAVNGYCLTGALELVTACDIIVASENAIFGDTHARWGMSPVWGGSQRLPRIVGALKAKEMFFTCDMINASEAERIGLVNKVVPHDELDKAVHELTSKILANSQASIRILKTLLNRGLRLDYASALRLEKVESPGRTDETQSRLRAFADRTKDRDRSGASKRGGK